MANDTKSGLGLLPRLILGVSIPILLAFLIIGNMLFFTTNLGVIKLKSIRDIGYDSLKEVSAASLKESTLALNKLGEQVIRDKAASVAKELEIFLRTLPKPNPKNPGSSVYKNPQLREIAVQKVGLTGYTGLQDDTGLCLAHPNPQVEGTDLHVLAAKLPAFWRVMESGLKTQNGGYYDWKEPNGTIRAKYLYTVPIKGTNLSVSATTYIDEFSRPVKMVEEKINQIEKTYTAQYQNRFRVFFIIVFVVFIILLAVIYLYSFSVIRPIRQLSEIADKISMGDLKTSVSVKAGGEIKVLAESIERMQTSVKAAIERLQKRRG
jgi:HAMP domain-containing protein